MAEELRRPVLHLLPDWGAQGAAIMPVSMGAALARARVAARNDLPFRAVNRRDAPDFDPGMQRHHLLPRQLLQKRCFGVMFELIGHTRLGFEDFRANGLLLPATDAAAARIGLPLHRGPHVGYNAMVIERVGQVEMAWSETRMRAPEVASDEAVVRLRLLQKALRRRLLDPGHKRFKLNRNHPLERAEALAQDFSDLDAMADTLWASVGPETSGVFAGL